MIEYTIQITGIKVIDTEEHKDIVKQIDFIIKGSLEGQTFDFPNWITLDSFDPNNFITYENLTKAKITEWVESHPQIASMKSHMAFILEDKVKQASLKAAELPWSN